MMLVKTISIALLALSLTACQSTARSEAQQTADMKKVDNNQGLIAHYKQKLEQNRDDQQAMEQISYAYFAEGDIESADFYSQHLIEQGVYSASLWQLRGQIEQRKGNASAAIEAYLNANKLGNDSGKLHNLMGIAYTENNQFDLAEQAFKTARLSGYNDLAIKTNLSVLYIAQKQYHKAISILVPLTKQYPKNQKVAANLAIAFIRSGQIEQANEVLHTDYSYGELIQIESQLRNQTS
ncbi:MULTISPECIES: lipopolysaccharide assembly protein LapB [unclassified Vibrio]|uniref:Tetratricopeptide repeat protein n=1 Tax=Vibrio sp. HB236076 TaxID=3232307 RepID=A0AB39HJZ1_9VIBR|nr:tetratricopeptide repeat protein [Vibrio sp. HB161653]MDP5253170.1 tetratricopeptide repeat protein [Vibrio sp. HB161653]